MLAVYATSVGFYFIGFLKNNQKVTRLAFWLLSIVWVSQTALLVLRTIEFGRFPVMTVFEGMFFYVWILVSISLIVHWMYLSGLLQAFINLLGWALLLTYTLAPEGNISTRLMELFIFELLFVHVTFLILSYAVFTISFGFSMLYFLQHHLLKRKLWGKWMGKIGDLYKLEKWSYRFALVGFPMLAGGLILGVIWSFQTVGYVPWLDSKVLTSLLVLLSYGFYLFQYIVNSRRGYGMVLVNIASFLVVLINYFLSSLFTNFHIW
ncbi:cytochrome c biogenesis protein CcsA [Paenalkalicoccus suaedae]|uniref:Cytochrome c biogenesis protein CcsA n=2 Tax=Paenalkalicoccus suaedae TaxID=2592382 RepID=A0A859FKG6_9BACI|nr:cytochrome c biogenesis protein CcsA [Paenalkalicoccus suaedae]